MNPNGHPHIPRPGQLFDAQGGVIASKIPDPIPWDAFVLCGVRVLREGKLAVMVLNPQYPIPSEEVIALFRLLLSMHSPRPGPLDWDTVPETVRRHFQGFQAEKPTPATPP